MYFIIEDDLGIIWFSMLRNGIYSFDGKVFKYFGKVEGLCNLSI